VLAGSSTTRWSVVPQGSPELRRVAEAWQDDEPDNRVRLVQTAEELPSTQPDTVVPQQFGQALPMEGPVWPAEPMETYEAWPQPPPSARRLGLFQRNWFGHSDPNDPYRHYGRGQPLVGTSWRNRPWYFGLFVGGVLNDDLIEGRVQQNNSTFLGMRLGWDFDHYWGLEARYAFARPETLNGAGVPLDDPARDYYGDVSLAYYPWGDSKWRPYLSAGLGFTSYRFENDVGAMIRDSAFDIPLGVGLKYYYCNWFTIRLDIVNNITLATNTVDAMDNVSFMAGAEFRFGGRSPSYFPWHGNTSYW
jgi:hypothetical protein